MTTNRDAAYDRFAPVLADYAVCAANDPRRARLRAQLVAAFHPVARNIARRFAGRGEPVEDLEQVAAIGLLKALEGFDPGRERDFLSFAVPTMMGEVRRYFRDSAWVIRPPRRVKDQYLQVTAGAARLSHRLGRAPTVSELAAHLGLRPDEVAEAVAAAGSYRPTPLDRTVGDADPAALLDRLGVRDTRLDDVETRALLAALVAGLPERQRRMLVLRFVHDQTQSEIAAVLGVSQMQVSRLLARTLELMREHQSTQSAGDEPGPAGSVA